MTTKKPTASARKRTRRNRLAAVAAGTIAVAVLAAGALASAASITTAQPQPSAPTTAAAEAKLTMGPKSVTHAPPTTPEVGKPFLVDVVNGGVAKVTVNSAVMTSPTVLTLDMGWDSWAGATVPDPGTVKVIDANNAPAALHPLTEDALPATPVQPGRPVRGKVAYDITAGPATLVIKTSGATEATRIQVK